MKLLLIACLTIVATADSLQCKPNSAFKSDCNTCRCSPDGTYALCTLKACLPSSDSSNARVIRKSRSIETPKVEEPIEQPKTTKYNEYEMQLPGLCTEIKTFNHYCNICECTAEGDYPLCTAAECSTRFWNKDGTSTGEVEVIDGTTQPPLENYTIPSEE